LPDVDGRRGERHAADAQVDRRQVDAHQPAYLYTYLSTCQVDAQVDRRQVDAHLGAQPQRAVVGAGRQRHDGGQVERLDGQVELRVEQAGPGHLVAAAQQAQHHRYHDNRLQDAQPLRYTRQLSLCPAWIRGTHDAQPL